MRFDAKALELVQSLIGRTWVHFASAEAIASGYIEDPAYLSAGGINVAMTISASEVAIDDDFEIFTSVEITRTDEGFSTARGQEHVFHQGHGEEVRDVFIVEEFLKGAFRGATRFEATVDSGLVIVLDSMALGIVKRGFHGEDFVVSQAQTIEALEFHDSLGEWPQTLDDSYDYLRRLVRVSAP